MLIAPKWLTFDDVHCCHMGIAIKHKHPVPDRVKLSLVMFDIGAHRHSRLSITASRVPGCQKLQMTA